MSLLESISSLHETNKKVQEFLKPTFLFREEELEEWMNDIQEENWGDKDDKLEEKMSQEEFGEEAKQPGKEETMNYQDKTKESST